MSHNSLFDLHQYSIFEILKSNIKWNRVFVKVGALRSKISILVMHIWPIPKTYYQHNISYINGTFLVLLLNEKFIFD